MDVSHDERNDDECAAELRRHDMLVHARNLHVALIQSGVQIPVQTSAAEIAWKEAEMLFALAEAEDGADDDSERDSDGFDDEELPTSNENQLSDDIRSARLFAALDVPPELI